MKIITTAITTFSTRFIAHLRSLVCPCDRLASDHRCLTDRTASEISIASQENASTLFLFIFLRSSFLSFSTFCLIPRSRREHCFLCISNKTIITSARSVCARTSTFERRPFSLLPMNACDIANPRVDHVNRPLHGREW